MSLLRPLSTSLLIMLAASTALADPEIDALEARPAKSFLYRTRTTTAQALFTLQETDCVYETIRATVTRTKSLTSPNDPEKLKSTYIEYEYGEWCQGYTHSKKATLTIEPSKADIPLTLEDMSTGRIKVDLPIRDCIIRGMSPDLFTCEDYTRKLDITIDWTGEGEISRSVTRNKDLQGDQWNVSRLVVNYRLAVATLDGRLGNRVLEEVDDKVTSSFNDFIHAVWTEPR